jgi:hypothetical protein
MSRNNRTGVGFSHARGSRVESRTEFCLRLYLGLWFALWGAVLLGRCANTVVPALMQGTTSTAAPLRRSILLP